MKQKMREFPPEMQDYEKVYTSERYQQRYKPEKIQKPDGYKDLAEYETALRDFLKQKSTSMWNDIVQAQWIFDNFKYIGNHWTYKVTSRGGQANIAFSIFVHDVVESSHMFVRSSYYFNRINTYFKELFPRFHKNNPFKNPELYEFPFKNITIDYMHLVHQMPERMDMLVYADENNMKYNEFLDFVINYVGKYNETEPKDVYVIINPTHFGMYVKNLKKKAYGRK